MPTLGRPITLPTIIKRLRHLRDNAFYDMPDQQVLDDISSYLASGSLVSVKHLRNMIIDLQAISDRAPTHLEDSDLKMLTSCIDGLARIETDRIGATKELKALSKSNAAKAKHTAHVEALERVLADVKPTKPNTNSITAIIGAIDVLLAQAGCGAGEAETFDTLHHLVDVLERLA